MSIRMFFILVPLVAFAPACGCLGGWGCGQSCGPAHGPGPGPAPAQVPAVKYTCPMHPEVVVDAPGTCPKCGMNLVIKQ
jgi:hypothetical protein